MGTYLELVLPEERQTDKQVIDAYYDHVAAKERDYYHDSNFDKPEELQADFDREFAYETLEEVGYIYISEQLYSSITENVTIGLRDLFPGYYKSSADKQIIYGDDIDTLLSKLYDTKDELKGQDDNTNWELTFETQMIALCEFALEHGYGIKLS